MLLNYNHEIRIRQYARKSQKYWNPHCRIQNETDISVKDNNMAENGAKYFAEYT